VKIAGLLAAILLLAAPAAAERGPRDPRELETFLDGAVPALLESYDVPGLVISVVANGRTLLAKGYGYADLERRQPMDGERTLVRVASSAKLFTATAALQLVEAGKLDLHSDVNSVLEGFRIEEAYGEPITLHHLLTHTAGFDDRFLHTGRSLGVQRPALGAYLARRMPPRVMPPGRVVSYSNHGLALVGHLVERASGQPFEAYVQEHIFDPLAMSSSRFFLEAPANPDLAVPYRAAEGTHRSLGYDHTLLGPAAELNATAADMAKFMLAHLQQGPVPLLDADTERLMQERQFSVHPKVAGWAYGFDESFHNGVRAVGHGGSWRGFESLLLLFPDEGFGVFASANASFDALGFYRALTRSLVDHYLPAPPPERPRPPDGFAEWADRYTGTYLLNRRMRGDFMKLGQLLQYAEVALNPEGGLTLTTAAGGLSARLIEVAPDLFRFEDEDRYAHFFVEPDTGTEHLVLGGFLTLDRVPWWQRPLWHAIAGIAAALLLAGTLVGYTLGLGARWFAAAPPSPVRTGVRVFAAVLSLLYLAGLAAAARELRLDAIFDLMIEVPGTLRLGFMGLTAAALLSLATPWLARRGIRSGEKAPLLRLHLWLFAGACLVLGAGTVYWNLFGAWLY
jgi:CubicO group peptidase (beta-lactamase class C family)